VLRAPQVQEPFSGGADPINAFKKVTKIRPLRFASGPQPFLDHMTAHHIPGILLPLVILLELGAGTALMVGWKLPYAAGALALFCVAAALVFHLDLADKAERTLFIKDLAIAGALMVIAAGASRV
jgi:putative oxidoreductase